MNTQIGGQASVNLWVTDITSDDWLRNMQAVKNWKEVAKLIGEEKTREELVKYLEEFINFEDRVLRTFVDSLSDFDKYIGGRQYTPKFTPVLERLCYSDDSYIRERAIDVLVDVGINMEPGNKPTQFLSLVKKLSIDNYHTSKCSAAALICRLFGSFNDKSDKTRREAFRILEELMQRDIPMVTKSISINIRFLLEGNWDEFRDQVFKMVEMLCSSSYDTVRVHAIKALHNIASYLNKKTSQVTSSKLEIERKILPLLVSLLKDPSWKVRHSVCTNISNVCESFPKEIIQGQLLTVYMRLLHDPEKAIRLEAIRGINSFASSLAPEIVQDRLMPEFSNICNSKDKEMLCALGQSILDFSPPGRKLQVHTYQDNKMNAHRIFLALLNDPDPDIKLVVLSKLSSLLQSVIIEAYGYLLPAFQSLISEENWKVRVQVPKYFSYLSNIMGERFINNEVVRVSFVNLLEDKVFCVREEALNALKLIVVALEKSWMENHLLGFIEPFLEKADHTLRLNYFLCVQKISKNLTAELLKRVISKTKEAYDDKLPNVRMAAVAALSSLLAQMKEKKSRDEMQAWIKEKKEKERDRDALNSLELLYDEAVN